MDAAELWELDVKNSFQVNSAESIRPNPTRLIYNVHLAKCCITATGKVQSSNSKTRQELHTH